MQTHSALKNCCILSCISTYKLVLLAITRSNRLRGIKKTFTRDYRKWKSRNNHFASLTLLKYLGPLRLKGRSCGLGTMCFENPRSLFEILVVYLTEKYYCFSKILYFKIISTSKLNFFLRNFFEYSSLFKNISNFEMLLFLFLFPTLD